MDVSRVHVASAQVGGVGAAAICHQSPSRARFPPSAAPSSRGFGPSFQLGCAGLGGAPRTRMSLAWPGSPAACLQRRLGKVV